MIHTKHTKGRREILDFRIILFLAYSLLKVFFILISLLLLWRILYLDLLTKLFILSPIIELFI